METVQEKFQKGIDLQERGLYDHAIKEYELALNIEPNNVDILINAGAAYLQKGLGDKAIKLLRQALANEPNNSLALYNIGKAYIYIGDYSMALASFERAEVIIPEDVSVKKSLAFCHKFLGNLNEAAEILFSIVDALTDDIDALLTLGNIFLEIQDYKKALDVFRRASTVNCSSILPLLGIFEAQLANGNVDKAMTTLRRTIMMEPHNQELQIKLVDLLLDTGKIQEAVDTLKRGLTSLPKHDLLQEKFNELARRMPILKKKASASEFQKIQSPYETDVYDVLDALYDCKIDIEVAVKELKVYRRKSPNDLFVAEELANLLFQARAFEEAAALYSEIFMSHPQEPQYRVDLAKSLTMNGDSEAARKILTDAIRELSSLPELVMAMAELDLFDKDFEKAAARLEMILKEYPDELHALFLYAYTAFRLNELNTAEKTFRVLIEKSPCDEETALWFSRLSIMLGKPEQALAVWENFDDDIESLTEIIAKAELTLASGDSSGIMKYLKKIGDYHPRFVEDHLLFGKAFFFAGDFSSAQREFDLVLKYEAKNAEALGMSAMNYLIRNKASRFWNFWQQAVENDSLYAVIPAFIVSKSLSFTQRERLKTEIKKMLEISQSNEVDNSRLVRLLRVL